MPLYPLGLRPMAQPVGNTASLPAVVLTTQYWQPLAGNQPALPNAANSQTRPFLLPVIWHSGCWVSGCWLTLQPQLEDTDLWPAYVLWRRSSLCAPKPHWSQGEEKISLPSPIPLFSQALLMNWLGILGGNMCSVNSFFFCLPLLCSQECGIYAARKSLFKRGLSL